MHSGRSVAEVDPNFANKAMNTGRWTKSKDPVILSAIRYRQNPLQSAYHHVILFGRSSGLAAVSLAFSEAHVFLVNITICGKCAWSENHVRLKDTDTILRKCPTIPRLPTMPDLAVLHEEVTTNCNDRIFM